VSGVRLTAARSPASGSGATARSRAVGPRCSTVSRYSETSRPAAAPGMRCPPDGTWCASDDDAHHVPSGGQRLENERVDAHVQRAEVAREVDPADLRAVVPVEEPVAVRLREMPPVVGDVHVEAARVRARAGLRQRRRDDGVQHEPGARNGQPPDIPHGAARHDRALDVVRQQAEGARVDVLGQLVEVVRDDGAREIRRIRVHVGLRVRRPHEAGRNQRPLRRRRRGMLRPAARYEERGEESCG